MKPTPFGPFDSGAEYRKHLVSQGYTDLGWQNGWSDQHFSEWRCFVENEIWERGHNQKVESISWNNRGTYVTFVLHGEKKMCSVDMGD